MKTIDRDNLKFLRKEITEVLSPLGEKHDLKFSLGQASFSSSNATLKIEIAIINPDGSIENKDRENYKKSCHYFGLKPEWIDKEFTAPYSDRRYKIIGLLPQSHKYPVLCQCLKTGKDFKLAAHSVEQGIKKELEKQNAS